MKRLLFIFAIILVFIVSGCLDKNDNDVTPDVTTPQAFCTKLCVDQLLAGNDLSLGPCLSELEGVEWNVDDWSCDVAHSPRRDVDDSSVNQCQDYRKELTNHFVEVTPNCEFIREN